MRVCGPSLTRQSLEVSGFCDLRLQRSCGTSAASTHGGSPSPPVQRLRVTRGQLSGSPERATPLPPSPKRGRCIETHVHETGSIPTTNGRSVATFCSRVTSVRNSLSEGG